MSVPATPAGGNAALIQQVLPMVIGVAVLGLVMLRNRRGRRLRLEFMWVAPLLIAIACGLALWRDMATGVSYGPVTIVGLVAATAAGSAVGWWRGSLMRITVDPATEALTSQASPIGLILIGGVFILRFALRAWVQANPEALPISAAAFGDGFLLFAAGLVVTQRVEMWLRARRQLAIARAGGPASSGVGEGGANS